MESIKTEIKSPIPPQLSSFYSQSSMNQLHGFSTSPGANQPIRFKLVTQTPNQETPQAFNLANEQNLTE